MTARVPHAVLHTVWQESHTAHKPVFVPLCSVFFRQIGLLSRGSKVRVLPGAPIPKEFASAHGDLAFSASELSRRAAGTSWRCPPRSRGDDPPADSGSHREVDGLEVLQLRLEAFGDLGRDDRAWAGVEHELGQLRFLQPLPIVSDDFVHIGRGPTEGDLSWPLPDRFATRALFMTVWRSSSRNAESSCGIRRD